MARDSDGEIFVRVGVPRNFIADIIPTLRFNPNIWYQNRGCQCLSLTFWNQNLKEAWLKVGLLQSMRLSRTLRIERVRQNFPEGARFGFPPEDQ